MLDGLIHEQALRVVYLCVCTSVCVFLCGVVCMYACACIYLSILKSSFADHVYFGPYVGETFFNHQNAKRHDCLFELETL